MFGVELSTAIQENLTNLFIITMACAGAYAGYLLTRASDASWFWKEITRKNKSTKTLRQFRPLLSYDGKQNRRVRFTRAKQTTATKVANKNGKTKKLKEKLRSAGRVTEPKVDWVTGRRIS